MLKKIGYLCLLALCIFTVTSCRKDTDEDKNKDKEKEVCNEHIDINLDNKCDNCDTTLEEKNDDRVLTTLTYKENLYKENYERIIIIDFENNNVMRKRGRPDTKSYQNLEFKEIATFTEEQEQELVSVIKKSNLLKIDNEYNKQLETPVEGWELEIKFGDNTEMKSIGKDEIPLVPFLTCAIPLYKFCNETVIRFWPKTLTVARLKELVDRCNSMVEKDKEQNGSTSKLFDSNGLVIEGLGFHYAMNSPKYSQETKMFYDQVFNYIYREDSYDNIVTNDGANYSFDDIAMHLLNYPCDENVFDNNGNIMKDEMGYVVKEYRYCPICTNITYSIKNTNSIYGSKEKILYIMLYEWCAYDCLSDMIIDGYF